jgi:general secretion pathway protein D
VQNLRSSILWATFMSACLLGVSVAPGQDADADQAKALLNQGIAQYNALQFKPAKATLSLVNADYLSDADKRVLDDYLNTRVDPAIKAQTAALDAYRGAEKAAEEGKLAEARDMFKTAAASEYLPATVRQDAQAQLALVEQKILLASAADEPADGVAPAPPAPSGPEVAPPAPPAAPAPMELPDVSKTPVAPPAPATQASPTEAPRPLAPQTPAAVELPPGLAPAAPAAVELPLPAGAGEEVLSRQQRVDELLASGQQALDQDQPERAVGYFQRALALDPNNEVAKRQLTYAGSLQSAATPAAGATGATAGSSSIIGRMEQRRQIAKQAANVEFDKAIQRSQELLGTADSATAFDSAEAAARSGRSVVETYRDLYTEREYREKLAEVDSQIETVNMARQRWEQQRVQQQAEEVLQKEQTRQARSQEERAMRVEQLTNRVKTLRAERDYEQALEIAKQIVAIEPTNSWATDQVDSLDQFILLKQESEYKQSERYHERKQAVYIREQEIPWFELIKYPRDWQELTARREPYAAGRGGESQEDRDVRLKLQRVLPTVTFDAAEFENAIEYLREYADLNIHVNWDALELEGILRSKEVNLRLNNVTTEKALKVILDDVGGVVPLSYVIDDGVVTISTRTDLSKRTYTRVYDIRDLIVRVPNFEAPDVELSSGTGNNGTGNGGFGNQDNGGGNNNENVPSRQEMVDNIITLVTDTIDPQSWPPLGQIGSIRELNGQLVVTQTSDNHQQISNLIEQLRQARDLLVSIEARFISVDTGFLNSVGLDLDFFFNIGSPLGSTSVTDPWTGAVVPTSGGASGWGNGPPGNQHFTPLAMNQGSNGFTNMLGVGNLGSQITTPAMSLGGTFLDDIQVDFLIQATQASETTRTLNAPRLTLFNGQQAYVIVGTQQQYVADLQAVVAENAVAYNPVPASVGSATSLTVEAVVSADRRYVTLTVWPRIQAVLGFDRYAVTTITTDAQGNPLTGEGFIQLPNVSIQEVQTTVSVPDGGTLLLGGQTLSTEVDREMGVPLLNKIPVISRAFSNRGVSRDEQTLLILIKPKIIIHDEEEKLQFPR